MSRLNGLLFAAAAPALTAAALLLLYVVERVHPQDLGEAR